jgi:hypothetical protein
MNVDEGRLWKELVVDYFKVIHVSLRGTTETSG